MEHDNFRSGRMDEATLRFLLEKQEAREAQSSDADDPVRTTYVTQPEPCRDLTSGRALAMVYSPYQNWQNLLAEDRALRCGTLFAELNLPFEGRTILSEGRCNCE